MSRNAYEIRLETLCLARDILSENLHVKNDQAVKRAGAPVSRSPNRSSMAGTRPKT
jgi:hypothetical protein